MSKCYAHYALPKSDETVNCKLRSPCQKDHIHMLKILISQSTTQWSDYRKSLLGQFIRICLKIEQNCRLFLDIFSSVIMDDLFMTFTSRLKVDAKCVYQQSNWITVANYFGTPPVD